VVEAAVTAIAGDAAVPVESWVGVGDGVELRVLDFEPRRHAEVAPLVFVPGWVSVVEGWTDLLRVLVPGRRVLYVETRE